MMSKISPYIETSSPRPCRMKRARNRSTASRHVGFTPDPRRIRCDAANDLKGRKRRYSMSAVFRRPFNCGHRTPCRRTGDKGYETGFCFCVLGCPLKGYFARLNTNSRVTPAGVRGFVNFNSSSVIDVTIRR